MPAEGINPVEFPQAVNHVWQWFLQLNAKRPNGMNGFSPIPESEIGWFFLNRSLSVNPWVIDAIARLDLVALKSFSIEK